MNKTLQEFARNMLKKGLAECSIEQQNVFKRMYSNGNLELPINDVVDKMPEIRLDWAMIQVETTIQKNIKRELDFLAQQDIVVPEMQQ